MTANNLWGNLPEVSKVRTPEQILREQASELTRLTSGLIVGMVEGRSKYNIGTFNHGLKLRAPTLNNYTASILDIGYEIGFYPVHMISLVGDGNLMSCDDEEEFLQALGEILASPETHKLIKSLLAHINSTKDETGAEKQGSKT